MVLFKSYLCFVDCNQLRCFVEVSKSVAESSEIQLSDLCEIGVAFTPLIYDLPENTGLDKFHTKCKSVLNSLKRHGNLSNTMVNFIILFGYSTSVVWQ